MGHRRLCNRRQLRSNLSSTNGNDDGGGGDGVSAAAKSSSSSSSSSYYANYDRSRCKLNRSRRRRREQSALKPFLPLKVTPSESSTHLAGPRLQWEQNEAGAMGHWPGASTWLAATPGREGSSRWWLMSARLLACLPLLLFSDVREGEHGGDDAGGTLVRCLDTPTVASTRGLRRRMLTRPTLGSRPRPSTLTNASAPLVALVRAKGGP